MSPDRSTSTYLTGYAPAAIPPGFQTADFIAILSIRRWLVLKVALTVILLATVAALLMPRQYTSSAVVMLDQRKNNITDLSAVLSQLPTDPTTLQNQIQIITSRELASDVITRLQLYNDPEFNPALVPQGPSGMFRLNFWFPDNGTSDVAVVRGRILENFLKHVSAEANGLSTAITIYANAKDPEKAQTIADAVAQAYVDDQVNAKRNANQGTSDWLDKRTNDLAQQLMLEQQSVEQYKVQHGLNDSAPGNSLVDQQMAAINAQIVQARSDLAEKQAEMDRVGPSAAAGNAAEVSQAVSSPLIAQLRGQQADLIRQEADLSSKYGPLHPKLQAVQAQERDLDAKITQEVTRIAGSLGNDVQTAKAHLNSLEQSLNQVERQANGQNQARVALQALQSNADSTKAQYEAFVGRLRGTEDQDTIATPESRIISSATLPLQPSAPRRGLIVGASIPLGFLLGILAALLSERFGRAMPVRVKDTPRAAILQPKATRHPPAHQASARPTSARPAPIYQPPARPVPKALPATWNGPPILAELANAEKMNAAFYVVDYPGSRYAEAMSALVGQLDSHEDGASVVAVTAAQGGESKSAVAVSIARAAAQMGRKTVLIDCDPGQLAMKAMGASTKAGLYEVLTGTVPLSQALAKDSRSGVYALAMTRRPPKLSTMFTSAAMIRLLQVLKEGADLVVLDCSRAAVPEAGMLARLCDATLLVTRKDLLEKSALANALEALTGAAPLAIIATR
jgi:polysaccharide biosynthesis transport protein